MSQVWDEGGCENTELLNLRHGLKTEPRGFSDRLTRMYGEEYEDGSQHYGLNKTMLALPLIPMRKPAEWSKFGVVKVSGSYL